jgi:hypothetical protein
MIRRVSDLIPEAQPAYLAAKKECESVGLLLVETCIKRSLLEHIALYAQGRENYTEICLLRQVAGLWRIDEHAAARKVTWTFLSKHIAEYAFPKDHQDYGKVLALDFALRVHTDGKPKLHWNIKMDVNDNEVPDYEEAGKIFEKHGFIWGGRWKTPDRPHIQWPLKNS